MGNHTSHASTRLILPDGTVHEHKQPVTVAELMLDHPQQVVVEFQPQPIGRKTKPLPADFTLEKNKVYLMVPMRKGSAVSMSSDDVRRVLSRANAVLKSGSFVGAYTGFIPVFARMCPAAVVKSRKKVEKRAEKVAEVKPELFAGGEDGSYLSRQLSVKSSWKPSLDTIKEKSVKAKIQHWLL
ncbi:hypothetical protein SSX86_010449 [Deinandra increscens subsp. villosa]|uniref:Uncharacterized protein n=1 Tax=Deinandra increscens subsp. villosa TaxID=3103831 RepID=A0AAP0H4Y6_9ASTR